MKSFLYKAKYFFKRNIYPITVCFCTILILSIITISAYSSITDSNQTIETNTQIDSQEDKNNGDKKNENNQQQEVNANSKEVVIFELPFDNATITKEFTDSSLLYDNTTKMWCTHQGIDFGCENGQIVKAVYSGTILKIENSMMNGTVVYLKISDELTVVYKGLSSDISLNEGDKVKSGDVIGKISSFLAEKADGIHLHLELLDKGKLIDPTNYFSFNK